MRTIWTGHRHDSRSAQKLGSWSSSKWTAGRFVRRENATQADQTKWPTEIYRNEYRLTAQVFLHLLFATTLNRTAKRTKSTGLHQFINWFVKQKGQHLVGLTLSKLNICWSSSFFFLKGNWLSLHFVTVQTTTVYCHQQQVCSSVSISLSAESLPCLLVSSQLPLKCHWLPE